MSSKQASSNLRGPQTGAPPSLEQVPLERLQVDPAYQRATDGHRSRRIITGMVREWKWPLCQPLMVSRRNDGELFVLDGQHRLAGARERGDIPYLPCVVLARLDQGAEALAFVDLNTQRQALSQADIFAGRLAAGDQSSILTATIIEQSGWRIVRSDNTQGWKPGDLTCAPMLATYVKREGEPAVRAALTALRTAYRDQVVTGPAKILMALIALFKPRGALAGIDPTRVATAMAPVLPSAWMLRAETLRAENPGLGQVPALVAVISREYTRCHALAAPAAPVAAPVSAALPAKSKPIKAVPKADPFGVNGKSWCHQCEENVSRTRALACKSKFCAVKKEAAA